MSQAAPYDPFASIRIQFLTKLEAHADAVDAALAQIEQGAWPPSSDHILTIRTIAHKISGVGATLGFETLGAAAARLDLLLSSNVYNNPDNATMTKELVALFLQELDLALDKDAG